VKNVQAWRGVRTAIVVEWQIQMGQNSEQVYVQDWRIVEQGNALCGKWHEQRVKGQIVRATTKYRFRAKDRDRAKSRNAKVGTRKVLAFGPELEPSNKMNEYLAMPGRYLLL
jgi:hypothetical protein